MFTPGAQPREFNKQRNAQASRCGQRNTPALFRGRQGRGDKQERTRKAKPLDCPSWSRDSRTSTRLGHAAGWARSRVLRTRREKLRATGQRVDRGSHSDCCRVLCTLIFRVSGCACGCCTAVHCAVPVQRRCSGIARLKYRGGVCDPQGPSHLRTAPGCRSRPCGRAHPAAAREADPVTTARQ